MFLDLSEKDLHSFLILPQFLGDFGQASDLPVLLFYVFMFLNNTSSYLPFIHPISLALKGFVPGSVCQQMSIWYLVQAVET